MSDRQAPWNDEAEIAVLGSLLINAETWYQVRNVVKPEDFNREKNRWIYQAMVSLRENKRPIDEITVAQVLKGQKDEGTKIDLLQACGGAAYLCELVRLTPTPVHAKHYAKIVAKLSWKRQLIRAGNTIANMGYNIDSKTSEDWLNAIELLYHLLPPSVQKKEETKPIEPKPIEEIRQAVKKAPPERAKEQTVKRQYKGGVQI